MALVLNSMLLLSPLPPRPFTPTGVKGSLNSRFGLCAPNKKLPARGCGTFVLAREGQRNSRSQWIGGRFTIHPSASKATRDTYQRACKVSEANEHADVLHPAPLERAEQRSVGRIRAGACLSVASLRPTPPSASSARYPAGARYTARLFFGYFLLAKQKKVPRPPGRNPACPANHKHH